MKTFINVLYRRILYRIPLKFLLLLLAIFGLLFASFSSALTIPSPSNFDTLQQKNGNLYNYSRNTVNITSNTTVTFSSNYDFYCFKNQSTCNGTCQVSVDGGSNKFGIPLNDLYCVYASDTVNFYGNFGNVLFWAFKIGEGSIPDKTMTSLQCQTEYNLIPISSVDQNYCTTNNLCPSCPSCPTCPSGGSGRSNVYINDILHIGAPNIVMNISEEIDWDYGYTAGGNNMNIDIVGYNVDYDKIDSIVDNQSYKPSSEDFANILGILAPYTKIIVFFVFLFLVWAWIKKPFRSKKL